mmetsp:Transcript_64796/g.202965  ORF Transcript_64796/g.202965 Transcript_64796/m.202965 type:complete len:381 (+) Transcript_64796:548-1690(+)
MHIDVDGEDHVAERALADSHLGDPAEVAHPTVCEGRTHRIRTADLPLGEAFGVGGPALAGPPHSALSHRSGIQNEQIVHPLVEDLEKRDADNDDRVAHLFDAGGNAIEAPWKQPLIVWVALILDLAPSQASEHVAGAEERVGLAAARLAVGEEANLVPVQGRLHERRDFVEDLGLLRRGAKDPVEAEAVLLLAGLVRAGAAPARQHQLQGRLVGEAAHGRRGAGVGGGPHSGEDAHVPAELLHSIVEGPPVSLQPPALALQVLHLRCQRLGPRALRGCQRFSLGLHGADARTLEAAGSLGSLHRESLHVGLFGSRQRVGLLLRRLRPRLLQPPLSVGNLCGECLGVPPCGGSQGLGLLRGCLLPRLLPGLHEPPLGLCAM